MISFFVGGLVAGHQMGRAGLFAELHHGLWASGDNMTRCWWQFSQGIWWALIFTVPTPAPWYLKITVIGALLVSWGYLMLGIACGWLQPNGGK